MAVHYICLLIFPRSFNIAFECFIEFGHIKNAISWLSIILFDCQIKKTIRNFPSRCIRDHTNFLFFLIIRGRCRFSGDYNFFSYDRLILLAFPDDSVQWCASFVELCRGREFDVVSQIMRIFSRLFVSSFSAISNIFMKA